MTAATQPKPSPAAAGRPAKILHQGLVAMGQIVVVSNVRQRFDEQAHKELVASVRAFGVISPITLRPLPADPTKYELIAGERRYRAARELGLPEILATVREADDEQARLIQVEENIHRKDLTPVEEARAFDLLTRGGKTGPAKYTVEQLADLVDKSKAYVYRSMALLELPKRALEEILTGRLTPAHGHQILRVPPFEREALVKDLLDNGYDGRVMTALELREHVEAQLGNRLDDADFPKDKPFAGMTACTSCPSNTGNQGMLFDGAQKGQCLNRECFATKTKQYRADFLAKTAAAHPAAKFVEYARSGGCVYQGMRRTGDYVVRGPLGKSKPPKGDYGLLVSSSYELWVATPDRQPARPAEAPAAAPADPKDAFIQEGIAQALYDAAAAAAKKLKMERTDWIELAKAAANDLPTEIWAGILGVGVDEGSDEDFQKASEATLRAIVLVNQRLPYRPGDADFKKLGVDVAAVKKAAKKDAEANWAAQLAADKTTKAK